MKNALFIGDTHCGSVEALWPREWLPRRTKHSGVSYLLDCWEAMLEGLPEQLDLVVLMGDLIDGKQSKSEGVGVFTGSFDEQVEGAIEILRPVAQRAKRIVRVDGTAYHEGYHNALASLDRDLGVRKSDTGQVLELEIGGRVLNVAHHPSGGSGIYKETQVGKEAVWSRVAAAEGMVRLPTWIVGAHRHYFMCSDDGSSVIIQTPPWQLSTHHALKLQRFRYRSKVGSVLMEQDERHWSGYRFISMLFDPPKAELLKVA